MTRPTPLPPGRRRRPVEGAYRGGAVFSTSAGFRPAGSFQPPLNPQAGIALSREAGLRPGYESHTDAVLRDMVSQAGPGWMVLRGYSLGTMEPGQRYALLNSRVGIALLEITPGPTTPDAPERLRQALDEVGFVSRFKAYPSIVHFCVPTRGLADLPVLMEQEFAHVPALRFPDGDAWVALAGQALRPEAILVLPELRRASTARGVRAPRRRWSWLVGAGACCTLVAGMAMVFSPSLMHVMDGFWPSPQATGPQSASLGHPEISHDARRLRAPEATEVPSAPDFVASSVGMLGQSRGSAKAPLGGSESLPRQSALSDRPATPRSDAAIGRAFTPPEQKTAPRTGESTINLSGRTTPNPRRVEAATRSEDQVTAEGPSVAQDHPPAPAGQTPAVSDRAKPSAHALNTRPDQPATGAGAVAPGSGGATGTLPQPPMEASATPEQTVADPVVAPRAEATLPARPVDSTLLVESNVASASPLQNSGETGGISHPDPTRQDAASGGERPVPQMSAPAIATAQPQSQPFMLADPGNTSSREVPASQPDKAVAASINPGPATVSSAPSEQHADHAASAPRSDDRAAEAAPVTATPVTAPPPHRTDTVPNGAAASRQDSPGNITTVDASRPMEREKQAVIPQSSQGSHPSLGLPTRISHRSATLTGDDVADTAPHMGPALSGDPAVPAPGPGSPADEKAPPAPGPALVTDAGQATTPDGDVPRPGALAQTAPAPEEPQAADPAATNSSVPDGVMVGPNVTSPRAGGIVSATVPEPRKEALAAPAPALSSATADVLAGAEGARARESTVTPELATPKPPDQKAAAAPAFSPAPDTSPPVAGSDGPEKSAGAMPLSPVRQDHASAAATPSKASPAPATSDPVNIAPWQNPAATTAPADPEPRRQSVATSAAAPAIPTASDRVSGVTPSPPGAAGLEQAGAGSQTGSVAMAPASPPMKPGPEASIPPGAPNSTATKTFVRRGNEMLALGDISSARLLFERAAAGGDGQAALALARTYDPVTLREMRVIGISADPALAVSWYKRALGSGVEQAREALARLDGKPRP